jgi:hypothetical protein
MKRTVICVDAGYLFAQGSVVLAGTKQPREILVLDPAKAVSELTQFAITKGGSVDILRIYWYDGAIGLRPTSEQERLGHLDNVKVRLGFINSVGQQKGVDSLIVTDLIELARLGAICDAVLLAGDEDVRVGVQIAQNYGVRIHLLGIKPSRGSQSKALLQEADTTSEWDRSTVEKFLSLRSVPAPVIATPTVVAKPPAGVHPVAPAAPAAPTEAEQLQAVAKDLADNLVEGDIKSLISHWATQKGLPLANQPKRAAARR